MQEECRPLQTITVTAGVIVNDNKVLIARRSPKENFAGGWEFPGGKLEQGETEQECLARELREELAIDVEVGDLCERVFYDYGTFQVKLLAYYCNIVGGTLSMTVHDNYKWVEIDRLLEYNLLPADIPIARKLMERYEAHKSVARG